MSLRPEIFMDSRGCLIHLWLTIFNCAIVLANSLPGLVDQLESNSIFGRNYVVIAPFTLRPRSQFSLSVHVFDDSSSILREMDNRSLRCFVSIRSGQEEVISHQQILYWNHVQLVYLQTPSTLQPTLSHELHVQALNSADNALIFNERSELTFDSRFVSVVFQTTRPIYRSGQTVRFRILVLDLNLIPFNDVLDVFIIDPDNFIMRRWLSTYTNNGVVSLKFRLPKLAKNGEWKIRSRIDNQVDEKSITVQTYYQPLFEVIVSSPPYIASTETELVSSVRGLYPSQKHIRGNATVTWSARKYNEMTEFQIVHEVYIILEERSHDVALPTSAIQSLFDDLVGVEVKIAVRMTEHMSTETVSGYSHTRIIVEKIVLKFLPRMPMVFTPGTSLNGHVVVSYEDGERVPREILKNSSLKVQLMKEGNVIAAIEVVPAHDRQGNTKFYDMLMRDEIMRSFLETNVLAFRFDMPEKADQSYKLKATFTNEDVFIEKEKLLVKKYSPVDEYLSVWTSSENLTVGTYATFHLKTNFIVNVLNLVILSKGIVLRVAEHELVGHSFTFSESVSADMAPWFHLVLYCVTSNGEIRSDTILVPVDGFSRYKTTFEINTGKNFRGEQVEFIYSGAEGAFIGMQAVRSIVHHLQSGHEITRSRMTNSFLPFEKNTRILARVCWISRNGNTPKETIYYPSENYIYDPSAVFRLNDLRIFSNLRVPSAFNDERDTYSQMCIAEECEYSDVCPMDFEGSCVGSSCPRDEREEYLLKRINYNSFIFDDVEGDWAFRELKNNDHVGPEFENVTTPKTADDWYLSAFNMDMETGFSIIETPVLFSTRRPLMAHVFGPTICHRGEQIGLKLHVHNFDVNQMLVVIKLVASDDYKFVHVESEGYVASYNARLSGGDHEILIYMPAETEDEIRFPVKPTVETGTIDIQFHISSQTGRQFLTHSILVLGEGALMNRHTSVTMDLKNRGFVLQYLDIVVEESPIIPYEVMRRYVYGSPLANLSISNSVLGPAVGGGLLTMNILLKRESKGTADLLFELHANIWSLHYLRYTNQMDREMLKNTLYECTTLYSEIISYFHKEGWFRFWHMDTEEVGSVWLAAWALRVFGDACYPDWEFQFWIDPYVLGRITRWLLSQQNEDGSFTEKRHHPFDGRFSTNERENELLSLTAHVLISLCSAVQNVNNELKSALVVACLKARIFLENLFARSRDPHVISIVAYALTLTASPEQSKAFFLLRKHMRTNEEGLQYWSRKAIPANSIKVENQRPYIQPRMYNQTDSGAVEATAWAVMVHLVHEGASPLVENIVQWLMSMKMTNNGFIALVDTAVAYRALTEFAYRARFLDITQIRVKIDLMTLSGNHTLTQRNQKKVWQSVVKYRTVCRRSIKPDGVVFHHVSDLHKMQFLGRIFRRFCHWISGIDKPDSGDRVFREIWREDFFTFHINPMSPPKNISRTDIFYNLTCEIIGMLMSNKEEWHSFKDVPQVWGYINLIGRGAGVAFVQLDVDYGITEEDFKDFPQSSTFDVIISEFYSHYQNKSAITVQTCLRFVDSLRDVSGAAVLEIETPTGYNILESDALEIIQEKVHPTLRDARILEGKTYWFFDFIENEMRCFNHTIKRWYPVANMTQYRNALLYEITAREQFLQVLINSTPLNVLSICEVCGSFQCPYCFYYNAAYIQPPVSVIFYHILPILTIVLREKFLQTDSITFIFSR